MSVKVLTDSTSYLDQSIKEELDIAIVPLSVDFGDQIHKETEIDNYSFYKMMDEKGIPKSSQPSAGDLYHVMEGIIKQGNSVLGVFLSSEMSGTYSTATIARDMILQDYPGAQIEVVDSRSNCMQLGFAVISAARLACEGKVLSQVKNAALGIIKKSRFLFVPNTLEYLEKGGRIGRANAIIGNLLKVVPILTVEDGVTTVFKKIRTKKKAVEAILEQVLLDIKQLGLGGIAVHHINCFQEAKDMAEQLKQKIKLDVMIQDIGPVIGLHVGPGALGIAYFTQKDMR